MSEVIFERQDIENIHIPSPPHEELIAVILDKGTLASCWGVLPQHLTHLINVIMWRQRLSLVTLFCAYWLLGSWELYPYTGISSQRNPRLTALARENLFHTPGNLCICIYSNHTIALPVTSGNGYDRPLQTHQVRNFPAYRSHSKILQLTIWKRPSQRSMHAWKF